MEKPILLVDFGRLMGDQLRNGLNINKKTFILDDYVVDAIPIEWIKKYMDKVDIEDCGMVYLSPSGPFRDMLEDWEQEHEESI